jgi:hypothetical protein
MNRAAGARDPHERFQAWLRDGASGDPPRDEALHGSVCTECAASIAALDALVAVDLARAGMPPMPSGMGMPVPFRERILPTPRVTGVALGVVVAGTLVGVGAGQFLRDAPPAVEQNVLGATGFPGGTGVLAPSQPQVSATQTLRPSPRTTPTASPTPTSVRIQTLSPTPVPTAVPTPTPTPTRTAESTPRPTPLPTASPTPVPTPTPTPSSSESGLPSPSAS